MRLTFLGATHEVTGSCTLIEVNGVYGIVDCGMEQGGDVFVNEEIPIEAHQIDFVILTHAHIDHSGMLPLLCKRGFHGSIYATGATVNLCEIMLRDCAHIQEFEAEWKTRKAKRAGGEPVEPVYDQNDAEAAVRCLRPCSYMERIQVNGDIEVRFVDAGHLMGSASIEVWMTEAGLTRKMVFSGDIGNTDQPLIRDPQYIEEADYVMTESTYGDRYHEKSGGNHVEYLARVIQETFDRGGNVVIPSFAVGRTQEMLYFIRQIKEEDLVEGYGDFPVYVDSPLANDATSIFLQCDREYFDEETLELLKAGINPLMSPGVRLSVSAEESRMINLDPSPKVIISASGMCEAGRIRHHLKHNLWRANSTILFVGYQAAGTTGRAILEGARKITLFGEEVAVKARIEFLAGKSGHADKGGLMNWMRAFRSKPRMVFVNHGEDDSVRSYAACLTEELGLNACAPYSGTVYNLLTDQFEEITEGVAVERKRSKRARNDGVYAALLAACQRLYDIARDMRGSANKDMARLTGQINALADKWRK